MIQVYITAVRSGNSRCSRCIHFLVICIVCIIDCSTSLQAQPICNLQAGRQRSDGTGTFVVTFNTVSDPIRILFHITFGICIPVLFHQIAGVVESFKVRAILTDILATRETVKTYQRVHVITTGGRTVLDTLRQ